MTEVDGRFVEFPSGREVDPLAWLREPYDGYLAGFLGYEFAWEVEDVRAEMPNSSTPRLWAGRFASHSPAPDIADAPGDLSEVTCDVSQETYLERVGHCVDDITAGELFEINFTTRFAARWDGTARGLYDRMRRTSTGDFFGFLQTDGCAIVSVSPEAFVRVEDGVVETRPIKGTRARAADPVADAAAAAELLQSEKDRAENVMIVDLMRNDLTRVCELGSVHVTGLCELESFAGVHHLVSTVRGALRAGTAPIDVLISCFPAGSITGAPKLRAIELAAEYEVRARGAYTGSMFVATADSLVSNVLIRTATLTPPGEVEYGAGGAIVSDSDPLAEWEEAWAKVAPLKRLAEEAH